MMKKVGWTVSETIGLAVINPRAVLNVKQKLTPIQALYGYLLKQNWVVKDLKQEADGNYTLKIDDRGYDLFIDFSLTPDGILYESSEKPTGKYIPKANFPKPAIY